MHVYHLTSYQLVMICAFFFYVGAGVTIATWALAIRNANRHALRLRQASLVPQPWPGRYSSFPLTRG